MLRIRTEQAYPNDWKYLRRVPFYGGSEGDSDDWYLELGRVRGHYNRGHILCWNTRFQSAPKLVKHAHIYRVCKTVSPKHRPQTCTETRCGQCSGPRLIRDHICLLWSSPLSSTPCSDQSTSHQCLPAEKNLCRSCDKATVQHHLVDAS